MAQTGGGIHWNTCTCLFNVNFIDEFALIKDNERKLKAVIVEIVSLRISAEKFKVIVRLPWLKELEKCVYPGSITC